MKMILILYIFTRSYPLTLLLQLSKVVQRPNLPAIGLAQDGKIVGTVIQSADDFLALAQVSLVGAAGVQEVLLLGLEGLVNDAPAGRLGRQFHPGRVLHSTQESLPLLFLAVDKGTPEETGLAGVVLLSLDLFEVAGSLAQRVDAVPLQEPFQEEGASLGEASDFILRGSSLLPFALLVLVEEVGMIRQSLPELFRQLPLSLWGGGHGVVLRQGTGHLALLFQPLQG